jgi:flagellar basal-body rod protein FlgC
MDFLKSIGIAAAGLKAQAARMRIVAENIANADSTAQSTGAEPYRRKMPTFEIRTDRELGADVLQLGQTRRDPSDFRLKHEPGHPAADANGYVRMPNVNSLVEQMDMREAQRSYEANLNVIGAARRMVARTLDILRV